MASLKDDFIYDEKAIDAEIEALENEQFDLGETLCICEGFETDEMILCESDSCVVGWFHYECLLPIWSAPLHKIGFFMTAYQLHWPYINASDAESQI